ncbi:PPK2 family polyphosphate kinase [Brooklawnia sp.]|uniref:PPK2 family polyphosphate kinase n=1 Tax=Brooklawnia sp. TaxID=2699740 RepID=UPI00311E0F1E
MSKKEPESLAPVLRCPAGRVDVRDFDPDAIPGYPKRKDKDDGQDLREELEPLMDDLQERLFAAGTRDAQAPKVLLVLQGLDTAGKGGTIRHVIGMMDPQGVHIHSFKRPTEEERAHDFLWRVERQLPRSGQVGIFDRSHYEDVLVQRVDQLAPATEIERRYGAINDFEAGLVTSGTVIVKCFLNISRGEQKKRLAERLSNPEKFYKYNPGDVSVASKWDAYMDAYSIALSRCNTDAAPWHVVPANRKWYRNWAITHLIIEAMGSLKLGWPEADFDVKAERKRVEALASR